MRARRALLAGIAVALTAIATGCGASGSTNASLTTGGLPDGASIAPASAVAFVSVVTDEGSSQWRAADDLLSKFPGKAKLLDAITSAAAKHGIDAQKLLPAVGPELDVVVLGAKLTYVGIAKPSDAATFDAALAKQHAVHEQIAGWTIFAQKQAALDTFTTDAAKDKLADDAMFKSAMAKLSTAAIVRAYVNGAVLHATGSLLGGDKSKLVALTAEVVPVSNGVKLDGTLTRDGATKPTPVGADTLALVPSGALAAVVFNGKGLGPALQQLAPSLSAWAGNNKLLAKLVPLLAKLGPALDGDNALYVLNGVLLPEVTLVATPSSPTDAVTALDRAVAQLHPKPVTIGAVHAQQIDLGQVSIYYGTVGTHLVVSDLQQAFQEVGAGGARLADDPLFKAAKSASGLPDSTDALVYVDLKDSVPLIETLAGLLGHTISPQTQANLHVLRAFTAWSTTSGNDTSFTAFLQVQ